MIQQRKRTVLLSATAAERPCKAALLEIVIQELKRLQQVVTVQRAVLSELSAVVQRCPHCSGQFCDPIVCRDVQAVRKTLLTTHPSTEEEQHIDVGKQHDDCVTAPAGAVSTTLSSSVLSS